MRYTGFGPTTGTLRISLLGIHLSTIDNEVFCRGIIKEQEDDEYNMNQFGYSSPLIYVVPGESSKGEDPNAGTANVVINLLMQLKAFQGQQNNIFRNSSMIKQQIIRQLQFEGENLPSNKLKNQIKNISEVAGKNVLNGDEFDKATSIVINSLKKNI